MSRFSRRWRSVSFRSGLWSALSVGIVSVMAIFALLVLIFALFVVTDGISQTALLDRAEDQLGLGVAPADLDLELLGDVGPGDRAPNGDRAFWAVLQDDVIVGEGGEVIRAVIDAEFSDPGFGIDFETGDELPDVNGLKKADGSEWFLVERTVSGPEGNEYRVVVAGDGIFSELDFARASLPVAVPVVLVLMAVAMAVTSYLMRRALRRVEAMRSEVELISQESLDRRVPLVDADDGIDKLAITMNDMLERLERSNDQQQQFLADASHELRSPIAGLLAQLEVAAAYPDRVDATALLPKLHGEAERLQLLVNDLMFLSRSEAGESSALSPAVVDIDEILSAEVEHQRVVQNDIDISITERSDATVAGNRRDLERALRNLVENAVRHATKSVRIGSERRGSEVVLIVVDDGQGIPDDQAEHIFERFVRLDEARGRDSGGSGLGLAITREIARKHGGDVALVPTTTGSRFELVLPVA